MLSFLVTVALSTLNRRHVSETINKNTWFELVSIESFDIMASKTTNHTEKSVLDVEADKPTPLTEESEIEQILNDIGGSFGRFQLFNYALFSIPITVIGIVSMSYLFTTLNLEYR